MFFFAVQVVASCKLHITAVEQELNLPASRCGNDLMRSATRQLLAYFVKIFIFNLPSSSSFLLLFFCTDFFFCVIPFDYDVF